MEQIPSTENTEAQAARPGRKRYADVPLAEKLAVITAWLEEHKAERIVSLNLTEQGGFADALLVLTAGSMRHAQSLADGVAALCHERNYEYLRVEGYEAGQWILVDLNDIVINIFLESVRSCIVWRPLGPVSGPRLRPCGFGGRTRGGGLGMTPTLLLILDGWGLAAPTPGNAPYLAPTPNLDNLNARCPHAQLTASGRAVGLPEGYMGNSEVGHLNIGAGRVVYQDMTRIDVALEDGSFAANPVLNGLLETVKKSGGRLHLAGLLSDGGVHSHIRHLEAICDMAARAGVPVRVHCIMDGRDTDPKSGVGFARALEEHLKDQPLARIAGLVGRFYAMDRDKRWDRVKAAWDLLVHGQSAEGRVAPDAVKALEVSYAEGITDEFVKPVRCASGPFRVGRGARGHGRRGRAFFFNFRADCMELTQALYRAGFQGL